MRSFKTLALMPACLDDRSRRMRAFTLLELMIVFVVLSVVFLIAFPQVTQLIERSRLKATHATAMALYETARWHQQVLGENGNGMIVSDDIMIPLATLVEQGYILPPIKDGWQRTLDDGGTWVNLDSGGALHFVWMESVDEAGNRFTFKCDLTECILLPDPNSNPDPVPDPEPTPDPEPNPDPAPPSEPEPTPDPVLDPEQPPAPDPGSPPPNFWHDPIGWLRWWLCKRFHIC